jgi:hypothetical protein
MPLHVIVEVDMRHAPKDSPDGGREDLPPSSLRGRLCEVFFSALLGEMLEPLMRRLGDKAELDDPVFGRAAGLDALRTRLAEWMKFLSDHDARYDRTVTVVGADRDVTEGTLEVRVDGSHKMVPLALLMERRREREVALRVFCATSLLGMPARGPTAGPPAEAAVPSFAADLLRALERRDAAGATACFEQDSGIRDATGAEHPRDAATRLLNVPLAVRGVADNGQACALEVAMGDAPNARLGLLVLQRGDSGLVRSLRIYSET